MVIVKVAQIREERKKEAGVSSCPTSLNVVDKAAINRSYQR